MKSILKISFSFIISLSFLICKSENINDIPHFSNMKIDSLEISLLPEDIYTTRCITRDGFDEFLNDCQHFVITDETITSEFLAKLLSCKIDSIIPYHGDTIIKKMIPYRSRNGKNISLWFNEDKLDISCRVVIYTNEHYIVLWLSDTGVLDADKYRCSGGKAIIDFLRELYNKTASKTHHINSMHIMEREGVGNELTPMSGGIADGDSPDFLGLGIPIDPINPIDDNTIITLMVRDYCGNHIYRNDSVERVLKMK